MNDAATNVIHVRPVAGCRVRDPGAAFAVLPPEGRRVRASQYWTRRKLAGEVTVDETPATPPARG